MSAVTLDRKCDCCGKIIPYDASKIHMEYDNHISHVVPYIADNDGNSMACYHAPTNKIFGLIDLQMYRNADEHTVVLCNDNASDRCKDICPACKLKFLSAAIKYIKQFEDLISTQPAYTI